MKKKLIIGTLCLIVGSGIFAGVNIIDKSQPFNLQIAAGELKISGYSFTIEPSKYMYHYLGLEECNTTVRNLTNEDAEFDMGDGMKIRVPANSVSEYSYTMNLDGGTMRIPITKILVRENGLRVEEKLILKIEPLGGNS